YANTSAAATPTSPVAVCEPTRVITTTPSDWRVSPRVGVARGGRAGNNGRRGARSGRGVGDGGVTTGKGAVSSGVSHVPLTGAVRHRGHGMVGLPIMPPCGHAGVRGSIDHQTHRLLVR
ncbi:MAG: hypothetical protein Q8K63_14350, partial [Acidimicrobiales bacterium]|nr:hypothetical protein [Acidimicrobiales bacterium]